MAEARHASTSDATGPGTTSVHSSGWRGLHPSTRVLVWQIGLIVVASGLLGALGHPLLFSYQWHKALHILGVVLFLGNIIVTALWMSLLARSRHGPTIHRAAHVTNWADVAFTAPGVFLILTNGLVMVTALGGFEPNPWALWGLVLFAASGIIWVTILVPAQEIMLRASVDANDATLPHRFDAALRRWSIAGTVAVVLPLIVLGLMVLKP